MVGLSGRYDLTITLPHFDDLFEGYRDENIYYNMPGLFIPNLEDPLIIQQLKALEIVFVVGENDVFLENNKFISNSLWAKGIWNALHLWDGESHKPRYWRHMVQLYL
jgi:esterase/lipase superfamily enzyme